MNTNWILTWEDNLIASFKSPKDLKKETVKQKRVGKNCPMTKEEREVYAKEGAVKVVKFLMDTRKIKLCEAHKIFKAARGEKRRYI